MQRAEAAGPGGLKDLEAIVKSYRASLDRLDKDEAKLRRFQERRSMQSFVKDHNNNFIKSLTAGDVAKAFERVKAMESLKRRYSDIDDTVPILLSSPKKKQNRKDIF